MTRYELFRKRIAPALFLGMVAFIAYDSCQKNKQASIKSTVVILLGDAEPRVRAVEAEMFVGGESVSVFRRSALPDAQIGPCRFEARMPQPDGELRIAISLDGSPPRRFTRAVHVESGGMVTVDLGRDLARTP